MRYSLLCQAYTTLVDSFETVAFEHRDSERAKKWRHYQYFNPLIVIYYKESSYGDASSGFNDHHVSAFRLYER